MKLLLLDLKLKAVREVRPGERGYVEFFCCGFFFITIHCFFFVSEEASGPCI